MTLHINSKTFDIFGKKYMIKQHFNINHINGLLNNNEMFITNCIKILNNNSTDVNHITFDLLIQHTIYKGYDYTLDTIILIYEQYFNKLFVDLQNSINNNSFNSTYFLDKYNFINKTSLELAKYLKKIDKNIVHENNNKHSIILTIKNYMFYNIILNKLYNYKNEDKYIYEILLENIVIDDYVKLFKIVNFYNKFSYLVKENRENYFNLNLNKKFILKKNNDNIKILEFLNNNINENIIYLIKKENIVNLKEDINYIRDMIKMCSYIFDDKVIFIDIYKKSLTERLLNNTNPNIENELLTSINYYNDLENYIKMKYQINDILTSKYLQEHYKKINVVVKTEKYNNIIFNKDIANFTVLNKFAWINNISNLNKLDNLNINPEISIYLDIYYNLYKSKYPDRDIKCDYEKSTSNIKIELNNKIYYIKLSLTQLIVLTLINNNININIDDISKHTNISIDNLNLILNSFKTINLININNNLISINHDCCLNNDYCDVIDLSF